MKIHVRLTVEMHQVAAVVRFQNFQSRKGKRIEITTLLLTRELHLLVLEPGVSTEPNLFLPIVTVNGDLKGVFLHVALSRLVSSDWDHLEGQSSYYFLFQRTTACVDNSYMKVSIKEHTTINVHLFNDGCLEVALS